MKPVIAESEAKAYVQQMLDDVIADAQRAGFAAGRRPKAMQAMREQLAKELRRKYQVIED